MNHIDGFDCPSCAWPDPDRRHTAEFCENGAKAVAWEATRKRVGPEFFAEHSVAELRGWDDNALEHPGRLTTPMYLAPGATHYRPIEWDAAFTVIAEQLRALPDPDRAAFYTSGRASNEAAFVYQLLARRFGTNNLPDCSNMCHESSGAALDQTIGVGKGTVSLDDISQSADLIVVVGQNPGTNHPRMLSALETAKRRGARIVAINPLPEAGLRRFRNPQTVRGLVGGGTPLADEFLPVRVNGDLALFAAVNKELAERESRSPGSAFDREFLDRYCTGLADCLDQWASLDWAELERLSGIGRPQISRFVDGVQRARSVIVCWAMGLTQHRNAVATIREVVNFLLLRGNIGRPGAGPCPVRGHSNVQGDRSVGIWERMPDWFLDGLQAEFGFDPPREHGLDTVGTITAMRSGAIDVFIGLGGNFASATPDSALTERLLGNLALTVQIGTKLNRTMLCHGKQALILPCLGRTEIDVQIGGEQFVTVEDSMSMVHTSRGTLPPASPLLRSEVAIVTGIAQALFGAQQPAAAGAGTPNGAPTPTSTVQAGGAEIDWSAMRADYRVIRKHIERVIPAFHAYDERVQQPGGFRLPNGARDRAFTTPDGKAHLTVNPPSSVQAPAGHLILQTVRSHDQFNTTVYGLDDRYRGIKGGRRVLLANVDDLRDLGFRDGDLVDMIGVWGEQERRAEGFRAVEYPTPRGCAAAYFPEANVLVPVDSVAEESNTPTSKSIVIRLEHHRPTIMSAAPAPGQATPR